MGLYETGIALRDYLRLNITDPINRDGNWIHYDTFDDINFIGKTPTIYIEPLPSSKYYRSIGVGTTSKFPIFQITIISRKTDTGRINSVIYNSSIKMLTKLTDLISSTLETASITVDTDSIHMLQELNTGGMFSITENMKANSMEFEVHMV